MRTRALLFSASLLASTFLVPAGIGTSFAQANPNTAPDNSAVNQRDRDQQNLTPIDQSNKPEDVKMTREIRRAIVKDDQLSMDAKNVKIITVDGAVTEFPIPSHDSQPRAMAAHPDGGIWFVETSTNALGRIDRDGRITEHPVPTPNASLRGVTVGAEGDLWYTANFANKIGRMAPDGTVRGEYDIPTANSGARCIAALSDGRLFFTGYDAGLIGEVVVG